MAVNCKRCGSTKPVKNGLMRGKQRYLCKDCGLSFTDTPARGKPLAMKAAAVLLYTRGLSMNRTAKQLGVSTPSVQTWLEQFAGAKGQKPAATLGGLGVKAIVAKYVPDIKTNAARDLIAEVQRLAGQTA